MFVGSGDVSNTYFTPKSDSSLIPLMSTGIDRPMFGGLMIPCLFTKHSLTDPDIVKEEACVNIKC